jgi:hypothetical protein
MACLVSDFAMNCYNIVYYFTFVKQFTSRQSPFNASRKNFVPLVYSFWTFWTSRPADEDNH